jgi:hypothetical protein
MYQRNSCDTDTHYHNGRPYPRSHADSCSTYIRIHDTRWLDMCRYRNIFSVFNSKMNKDQEKKKEPSATIHSLLPNIKAKMRNPTLIRPTHARCPADIIVRWHWQVF